MGRTVDYEINPQKGFSRACPPTDQSDSIFRKPAFCDFVKAFDASRALVQLMTIRGCSFLGSFRHTLILALVRADAGFRGSGWAAAGFAGAGDRRLPKNGAQGHTRTSGGRFAPDEDLPAGWHEPAAFELASLRLLVAGAGPVSVASSRAEPPVSEWYPSRSGGCQAQGALAKPSSLVRRRHHRPLGPGPWALGPGPGAPRPRPPP